jgi:ATP dependent DNA ligase domain
MAPTLAREPFHRDGWAFEEKVDGWRMLASKDAERVRLVSRNGRDHTRRFRDIAAAISKLSARTLLRPPSGTIISARRPSRTRSPPARHGDGAAAGGASYARKSGAFPERIYRGRAGRSRTGPGSVSGCSGQRGLVTSIRQIGPLG